VAVQRCRSATLARDPTDPHDAQRESLHSGEDGGYGPTTRAAIDRVLGQRRASTAVSSSSLPGTVVKVIHVGSVSVVLVLHDVGLAGLGREDQLEHASTKFMVADDGRGRDCGGAVERVNDHGVRPAAVADRYLIAPRWPD